MSALQKEVGQVAKRYLPKPPAPVAEAVKKKGKVVFATPFLDKPTKPFMEALEASIPLVVASGYDEGCVFEPGNAYISFARSKMLRKAIDAKADIIVFLDYDLSWRPEDLVTLIETEGDVVAGMYRFKQDKEEYMGSLTHGPKGKVVVRDDGCISAETVPAGFLKITLNAVDRFMRAYPKLEYGFRYSPSVDLFKHGASKHVWWGEDMKFSQRWRKKCGEIWVVPDLEITHHAFPKDAYGNPVDTPYVGNLKSFLLRSLEPQPSPQG